MITMIATITNDYVFELRSGRSKDYKIGMCWLSEKHAAWKRKDWLARNQDNVSKWSDISNFGPLSHWVSTIYLSN